ncbi:MAG: hypothetical protein K8R69_08120 [Deltaproteobacteria bacterium]|nr:hypothetical protein [Deltaproteobacteria bacterium]
MGCFCWVPLFWAIRKSAPWRAFQLGLLAGVLQCAVSFYWLYTALDSFGRLSSWQSFGLLCCLFLVLAAFLGAALGIARWIQGKTHISPLLVFPVVWVACDFVLNRWPFGGFPWGQAVYSQSGFLPFLQIADATGVYGVTALLVFVNQGLCLALERASGLRIFSFGADLAASGRNSRRYRAAERYP